MRAPRSSFGPNDPVWALVRAERPPELEEVAAVAVITTLEESDVLAIASHCAEARAMFGPPVAWTPSRTVEKAFAIAANSFGPAMFP
ncbi:hypothetical protein [Jannaschia sp. LMIT008]|uniref:hypothetical protein n=1 Tax=Jannaschia maritima TaxID=3032585 RepID=UPI0028113811|nr:hypothetical protein [Jannaschia sp. LMIT008]